MARPDDWTYNNQAKCYVRPDYADYPSLPRIMFKLPSNAKQLLTVKIKTEALTKKNVLVHPHDTSYKNKKTSKRLIFTHSSLRLRSQNRPLALLNSMVQSTSTPPQHTKKTRSRERTVACCICDQKSICSTKEYSCLKGGFPVSLVNQNVVFKYY